MLTTTTRRCPKCHELLDGDVVADRCPHCAAVLAPNHTQWPKALKRWLVMQVVLSIVAAVAPRTGQACWEWILRSVIRGKWHGQTLVPFAATTAECYPVAARLAAAWEQQGSPNLLDFDQPAAPARKSA